MGILFLLLFGVTLFVTYIAIRRAWAPTMTAGGVGAVLSVMFVTLYALTYEKTSTAQAIFAGLLVGLGFAGAAIAVARFFRTNQPSDEVRLVSRYSQEEQSDE